MKLRRRKIRRREKIRRRKIRRREKKHPHPREFYKQHPKVMKALTKRVLERDDYVCKYCKGKANTAHHTTYKFKPGSEKEFDSCESVCKSCHYKIHFTNGDTLGLKELSKKEKIINKFDFCEYWHYEDLWQICCEPSCDWSFEKYIDYSWFNDQEVEDEMNAMNARAMMEVNLTEVVE